MTTLFQDRKPPELVYGVPPSVPDETVFMTRALAERRTRIYAAIATAEVWRDFFSLVGPEIEAEVRERLDWKDMTPSEEDGVRTLDDAPFDAMDLPGYADGVWPGWSAQTTLDLIPRDLLERFVTLETSILNGCFAVIDPGVADDLAAELERRGYRCVRDDRMIERAHGL